MTSKTAPLLLLFGRTVLFILLQSLFALGFYLAGASSAWDDGAAWWPLGATLTNLICVAAMIVLFRAEGRSYWELFRIRRQTLGGDLLVLLGSLSIVGPLGFFPNILLANALFESPQTALDLLIHPLPLWAAYASLALFPVTQGLAELPLYFGYVMPRLSSRTFPDLRPLLLPALMLGLQHLALPLVFNLSFILWRAFMYLPFAIAVGLLIYWRPRLLPYLAVIHVLMDFSFALMLLPVAY